MNKTFFTCLIGILLLSGCSKKSTDPSYSGTSTFPLTTGSRWVYSREISQVPYNDSSHAWSLTYKLYRNVIAPDTLIDTIQTYLVDDSLFMTFPYDQCIHIFRHWYGISDGKLKEFGGCIFAPETTPTPQFYNTPLVILDFPLDHGKIWQSRAYAVGPVDNRVVGIGYIDVLNYREKCDIIRSTIDEADTSGRYYDSYLWYSDRGLMRQESDFGVEIVRDSTWTPVDSVRNLETMELLDFSIEIE